MHQFAQLQILRAVAALSVAFGHAQHDALVQSQKLGLAFERSHVLPWGAGVDLFFVISGFIMVYASERLFARPGASGEFFGRRVARVVPLYWLFSGLYVALLAQAAWAGTRAFPAAADVLASFAFWPTDAFGDGIPRPILTLGWTLNYEMFFYGVFALFLGFPRERAVLGVASALVGLVVVGSLVPTGTAALFFWTRPIVLEFALGMGLAFLVRRGLRASPLLRLALAAAGVAILLADPLRSWEQAIDWTTPNDGPRLLAWGLPATLLVAVAVLGPRQQPSRERPSRERPSGLTRAGVALGDASYALYLVHPFVIFGFRKVWLAAGLQAPLGLWPMVAVSILLSCLAALAIHRMVEKPFTGWAQGLVRRRAAPGIASA